MGKNYVQLERVHSSEQSKEDTQSARSVRHWENIRQLGLAPHIAELDAIGYTVVPPELVGRDFTLRLREALLDVAERRTGDRPQLSNDPRFANPKVPFGFNFSYLLFEDPVFQEAILHPVAEALVTHLLGENAILSNCLAFIKGPGKDDLNLHTDNVYIPAPFPNHAQVCNVTWLLTDYTKDDGALCFVPGSHQFARHPEPGEGVRERVAIEAPMGSIAFWHGNTWHGAFARKNPGVRINLINAYMRMYMRPQEPYRENVSAEMLARHPDRFARLLGQHIHYGWKQEGPDYSGLGERAGQGQTRWF